MENFRIYDGVCVGDIYYHEIEGVCVLADVTDYHYWFYALDIDAKYPSNQNEPRAFKTQILNDLQRPQVSLEFKAAPFTIDSIVFFSPRFSPEVKWGYCVDNLGDYVKLNVDGHNQNVQKAFCFQVEASEKIKKTASHLSLAI